MKHKHYEMIVAKAANMELVRFAKEKGTGEWYELSEDFMCSFNEECEYFLCLPQHKEACLHWLNGGDVQRLTARQDWLKIGYDLGWTDCHEFMNPDFEFRIKPKKEKRWLIYSGTGVLKEEYNKAPQIIYEGDQVVEIEVGVRL